MQTKSFFHHISMVAMLQTALQPSIFVGVGTTQAGLTGAAWAMGKVSSAAPASEARGESTPEAPQRDLCAPELAILAKEYKDNPDDISWGKYFTYLRDLLVNADFAQVKPADLIAANPTLSDLHVKVIDVGEKNMHLWSFPSIAESHSVLFAAPGQTTAIPLPLSMVLHDGRIVPNSFAAPGAGPKNNKPIVKGKGKNGARIVRGAKIAGWSKNLKNRKNAKGAKAVRFAGSARSRRKIAGSSLAKGACAGAGNDAPVAGSLASFGKYLVLIGGDRQTNTLWLKGFKLGEGPLTEAPELFASLPLFFWQNVSGKASFCASDIVLTIQPPCAPALAKDADEKPEAVIQSNGKTFLVKPTNVAVAGYRVVLKYMGGKFALAGHLPDDAPLSVALAFAQNISAGRSDIAKAWLIDPKLVSIPKYLGLVGRTTPVMRLVAMSGASGARYRLITSAKDDLIIDIGRITAAGRLKGQLAIKGLFVAPPDPYAANLAGTLVLPQASEKADPEGEVGPKPGTKAGIKGNLQTR